MRVLLFCKFPEPGMVKTRLARSVGAENAAKLQRAFIEDQLGMLSEIEANVTMCCDPFRPLSDYERLFGGGIEYAPQQGKDLGERMLHALHQALQKNESAMLIGSDLPDLPGQFLTEALKALRCAQVCLGPATDGGFYLLGLREPLPADIFKDVAWSGPQVLQTTLTNCAARNLNTHLLPAWPDVDTLEDLFAYAARNQNEKTRTMDLVRLLRVEESWKN
jgi:rSAM/selenodomain-associated transferase 1